MPEAETIRALFLFDCSEDILLSRSEYCSS